MKDEALIKKIQDAVLDMMKNVKFDKVNHIYTRISDGAWLQGVSTVSSIVPKDWLAAWGAKEAVKALGYSDYEEDTELASEMLEKFIRLATKYAIQRIEFKNKLAKEQNCLEPQLNPDDENFLTNLKIKEINEYKGILKDAKGAQFRKSKQALIDGKSGHEWLEEYVKAKIRNVELPKIPEGMLQRPLQQFVEWEQNNIDYWILSEARVAYPEKKYAGTLDGLAMMKTGKLAIIDFKFASNISEEYYLQTAGYQHTFEPYGISVGQRIIIRLPKTLTKDEWDERQKKYIKVVNTTEIRIVPTPYNSDIEAFLSALPVKSWINSFVKI